MSFLKEVKRNLLLCVCCVHEISGLDLHTEGLSFFFFFSLISSFVPKATNSPKNWKKLGTCYGKSWIKENTEDHLECDTGSDERVLNCGNVDASTQPSC
jgi:hypothetical protein